MHSSLPYDYDKVSFKYTSLIIPTFDTLFGFLIEILQCFRWFDDTMAEVLGFDQWNFHHKEDNLECKQQSHIQQNHLMLNIEYFIYF